MNYLAHLYLSFGHEQIMVGNYIADAIKGKQIENYPTEIIEGIILHRKIDEYTDNHPVVALSKNRIRHKYRKYAGVVIDMYYDHFLASGWHEHSQVSLQHFTKTAYRTLFRYYLRMPARMKRILPAMAMSNWLASYAQVDNIGLALMGMSRRTTFDSGIENGKEELLLHYDSLKNDFDTFFPDLVQFSKKQIYP